MARSRKLTRKEIQQDRIRTILTRIYDWLALYGKYLLGGLGLLLVLFVGLYLWEDYRQEEEVELQNRFSRALEIYSAPLAEPSSAGEDAEASLPPVSEFRFNSEVERSRRAMEEFSQLADEFPRAHLGKLSLYYVALSQEQLGQTEEAKASLSRLIEESDGPDLRNLARGQLADLLKREGQTEQATLVWEQMLDDPSLNIPQDLILIRLARAYDESGANENAIRNYRRLISEFPSSSDIGLAEARVALLEARMGPEEKKTPGEEVSEDDPQRDLQSEAPSE